MTSEGAAIQPFSAENSCRKCGGDTRLVYHASGNFRSHYSCPAVEAFNTSYPPEHHCVTCQRCRYSWPMAVLGDDRFTTAREGS